MARKSKRSSRTQCAGVRKSGKRKGTLKKGYKWPRSKKKCPVKIKRKKRKKGR